MRDLLLQFPSKETAVQFGVAQGFSRVTEGGEATTDLAAHEFALCVIGEHFVPTGNTVETAFGSMPEMQGDGKWWVLFRDLAGIEVPPTADPFIVWRSDSGLPRPVDPAVPSQTWA